MLSDDIPAADDWITFSMLMLACPPLWFVVDGPESSLVVFVRKGHTRPAWCGDSGRTVHASCSTVVLQQQKCNSGFRGL